MFYLFQFLFLFFFRFKNRFNRSSFQFFFYFRILMIIGLNWCSIPGWTGWSSSVFKTLVIVVMTTYGSQIFTPIYFFNCQNNYKSCQIHSFHHSLTFINSLAPRLVCSRMLDVTPMERTFTSIMMISNTLEWICCILSFSFSTVV